MEAAVADMLKDIDADAFILDCMPNPSPEEITERTQYLVNTIRTDHEGSVDGTHPNDLGFDRMVEQYQPQIMRILKKYGIK